MNFKFKNILGGFTVLVFIFCSNPAFSFIGLDKVNEQVKRPDLLIQNLSQDLPISSGVKNHSLANKELGELHSEEDVLMKLDEIISAENDFLGGLPKEDLHLEYIHHAPATELTKEAYYIKFSQKRDGLLVHGAEVLFMLQDAGQQNFKIVYGVSRVVPALSVETVEMEGMDESQLIDLAADVISVEEGSPEVFHQEWKWIYDHLSQSWTKVLHVALKDNPNYSVYVREDGNVFAIEDEVSEQVSYDPTPPVSLEPLSGSVTGRFILSDPKATGNNLTEYFLKDLEVKLNNTTSVFTNIKGAFLFDNVFNGQLDLYLKGKYFNVHTFSGSNLKFSGNYSAGVPIEFKFNPTGNVEFDTAQVNAYVHTLYVHDWLKQWLPSFSKLDTYTTAYVNDQIYCDAGYNNMIKAFFYSVEGDLHTPNFLARCRNTAYDAVIYHEYGHFLDDMAGGIIEQAYSEGLGDLLGVLVTKQSIAGRSITITGQDFSRNADNTFQYPRNILKSTSGFHTTGTAYSGFGWHLRERLMNKYNSAIGEYLANTLLIPTVLANPKSIPDAVWQTVLRDDDDANLLNLTQNFNEIMESAKDHNLYPFLHHNTSISANNLLFTKNIPGQAPYIKDIIGIVDTDSFGFPFKDYKLEFRSGNSGSWNLIEMKSSQVKSLSSIAQWDINQLSDGPYELKLTVQGQIPQLMTDDIMSVYVDKKLTNISNRFNKVNFSKLDMNDQKILYREFSRDGSKLFMYDRVSGNTDLMAPNTGWGRITGHALSEKVAVWSMRNSGGSYQLHVHDLASGQTQTLTRVQEGLFEIDAGGNYIVWTERLASGDYGLFASDVTLSGAPTLIAQNQNSFSGVVTDGDYVVWSQWQNSSKDIFVHKLGATTFQLTNQNRDEHSPAINNGELVWIENDNGVEKVWHKDLNTMSASNIISNNVTYVRKPKISQDLITWEEEGRILVYDKSLKTIGPLVNHPIRHTENLATPWKKDVVFMSNAGSYHGAFNIYVLKE